MKCRINKSGPRVLVGKGDEYSKVALETESYYINWLDSSYIAEEDFLNNVRKESFEISISLDMNVSSIKLKNDDGEFVLPLEWRSSGVISFKDYKTEAALLLLYVGNKCGNEASEKKIKSFVRSVLL